MYLILYLCFELHPVHDVFNNTTLSHLPREINILDEWYNESMTFLGFNLSDNIIYNKAACALRTLIWRTPVLWTWQIQSGQCMISFDKAQK